MKVDALNRRTRFVNFAPTGKRIVLTKNDDKILQLLRVYRWLPSNYIIALLGRDKNGVQHRLSDLRHELGYLICPSESWGKNSDRQPAVYGLSELGEKHAGPAQKFGNKVKHDLLACIVMASLELGCKEHGLPLYEWDRIQNSKFCTLKDWKLTLKDSRVLEPDWPPRAIGDTPRYYFYGVEVDRDTEVLTGAAHKTIARMFADYLEILESKSFQALGIPRFLIPIITTNATRMNSMIATLKEVAGDKKTDAFIFTTVPDILTEFTNFPAPSGDLLTREWSTTTGTFNILGALHGASKAR